LTALAVATGLLLAGGFDAPSQPEIQAGKVIASFYQCLLGRVAPRDCPHLFKDADEFMAAIPQSERKELRETDPQALVWAYFRRHSKIFLFSGRETASQWDDVGSDPRSLQLRYVEQGLSGESTPSRYPYLNLFVLLHGMPCSSGAKDTGISKEILFVLFRSTAAGEFDKVSASGLRVNGISVSPDKKLEPSRDLRDLLGLR
jgi:hypothetical protein